MKRIDDERLVFYLEHRDLIDTWAALIAEANAAAHRFYLTLADQLDGRLDSLGGDVNFIRSEGTYAKVGLYRSAWQTDSAAEPLVVIGFEWHRRRSGFGGPERHVGVRVDRTQTGGAELRASLGDTVRHVRDERSFGRSSSWWAAYRYAADPPEGPYWEDLTPYGHTLVNEVIEAWRAFAADVDRVVAEGRR